MKHLKAANARLKAAKCRLSIEVKGERLTLRGILPPPPGSEKVKPYQQRIHLGLPANPSGIAQAEKEAKKISALLDCKEFSWGNHQKPKGNGQDLEQALEQFKRDYLEKGGTLQTWKAKYVPTLSKISDLTPQDFLRVVKLTPPDSRNRQLYHDVVKRFAKFHGIPLDLEGMRGNYIPKKRDPPDDDLIIQSLALIPNPQYRWLYGMLSTYGLRPHEALRVKAYDFPEITIGEETKTGSRLCFPLFEDWIERFNLRDITPPDLNLERTNHQLGESIARQFKRYELPFVPYDLRHAFAIRTIREGWPPVFAARSMGHSLETHNRQYHRWITSKNDREIYDRLTGKTPKSSP
jgi:integrase